MARQKKPKVQRGGKTKYIPKRKICPFCTERGNIIDYKDATKLGRFISDRGKIEPRRRSGVCAKHQRSLAIAVKRARHLALLPYTAAHIHLTGVGRTARAGPRA